MAELNNVRRIGVLGAMTDGSGRLQAEKSGVWESEESVAEAGHMG